MKRTLQSSDNTEASSEFECPVCLTVKNPTFPFGCGHGVCDACDSELFCRADDRCPTCRAPRLSDSVNSRMSYPALIQRRERSLAQAEYDNFDSGNILFPVAGIIEVDATDFVVRGEVEEGDVAQRPAERRPHSASRIMTDARIRDVVGALINTDGVPMGEFFVAVAALRASVPRAATQSTHL